ncbi:MAG: response regulator transcription factor [Pseudomonadales bacterium]
MTTAAANKLKILVVEDEAAIRSGLVDVLIFHGYDVEAADNGRDGLQLARSGQFDLLLLDVMLPHHSGFDICEAVREEDKSQPIIMLTAKVSDEDIVHGLRLGADDYVGKPFSIEQLLLRIAAVLRRSEAGRALERYIGLPAQESSSGHQIDTANLVGDTDAGPRQSFTRREMDLLQYLHAHRERAVPREELLSKVWGYHQDLNIETRTVDIHIAKLRRKLERDPKQPQLLITIRGAGYRLLSL